MKSAELRQIVDRKVVAAIASGCTSHLAISRHAVVGNYQTIDNALRRLAKKKRITFGGRGVGWVLATCPDCKSTSVVSSGGAGGKRCRDCGATWAEHITITLDLGPLCPSCGDNPDVDCSCNAWRHA